MQFKDTQMTDIIQLGNDISLKLDKVSTYQEAAQTLVNEVYNKFKESIVLLRLFATIELKDLPQNKQDFVNNLAKKVNLPGSLDPSSFILTLFGTTGKESKWNNDLHSEGHQGIPLFSADFVSQIPMISALLEQLGFDLGWIRGEKDIIAESIGKMKGTFFVPDATTTLDSQGRHIIAAQDFVKQYNVKTVFGFGGGYTLGAKFTSIICFTQESFEKDKALLFSNLVNHFKGKTGKLINDPSKLF